MTTPTTEGRCVVCGQKENTDYHTPLERCPAKPCTNPWGHHVYVPPPRASGGGT